VALRARAKKAARVVEEFPPHALMVDVAVIKPEEGRGPEEEQAVADALLRKVGVRSVAILTTPGSGQEHSISKVRWLAGDPNLVVAYKEASLTFHLDLKRRLSRLHRSQGGSVERDRLRGLVQDGERVLVLGAGFGLTPCVLGAHTPCSEVIGVDPDPVAHEFAEENITFNRLDGTVSHIVGDPFDAEFLSTLGMFDRVCAFLPWQRHGCELSLSQIVAPAVSVVKPGGFLHAYARETGDEFDAGSELSRSEVAKACPGREVLFLFKKKVPSKAIGPYVWRVVLDFRLS